MGTYLLVDGNSLTYRAFFALPSDMATASGQVTNAVFGFTSMLINVIKDHHPDGMLVAFDRPEPTFRHTAEPEYKAQREAAPDILRQQMGLVREVLADAGVRPPVEALCGFVWVPSRDPRQLPMCQACKEVYDMFKILNDDLRDTPSE